VAICEETRDAQAREVFLLNVGVVYLDRGDWARARDIFAENLSFARANHDDLDVAMSSHRWKPLVVTARAGRIPAVCVQRLLVRRPRAGKDFARSRSDFGDAVIIARLAAELRCYC
jgi:hypothetical protein